MPRPMVALVALRKAVFPSETEVFRRLCADRPDLPPIGEVDRQEDVCTFAVGEDTAAISLMDAPIPWDDLEQACAHAWYWPEAAKLMQEHRAHVLVVVLSNSEDRVGVAMLLTNLVAAVASSSDATGICWVPAALVHPADAFLSASRERDREYLPLYLWVDFVIQERQDGSYALFTRGLSEFNLMEIEVHGSRKAPEFLLDRVFNVAHYLLENGPVLEHGETIGLSEDEEIPILHGPSMWDETTTVIQLGL
jgi:hypothetical protein